MPALRNPTHYWENRIMADNRYNKEEKYVLCEEARMLGVNKFIPYFPWSPMQAAMVLAPEREVLAGGEAGCIAGETRIYNPVSGQHIAVKDLYATATAPVVLTIAGLVQAEVPFRKGEADLYRVTTIDGLSCVVTMEHRFLTPHGWDKLSTLEPFAVIGAPSGYVFGDAAWTVISSIYFERTDEYFDLHVPGEEHYLAEGIWHHNSGKSDGALFCALVNVTVEDYLATYFRENERQLLAAGGVVWQMRRWLKPYLGSEVIWNEDKREFYWKEYNATIGFGFMAEEGDEENYIGFPRQLFGWEELTRFPFRFDRGDGRAVWNPYQFLPRSMRKPLGMPVNIRTIATTNPGGLSKNFVKKYFLPAPPIGIRREIPNSRSYIIVQPKNPAKNFGGRRYVHGIRKENPGLDHDSYDESEALADEKTKAEQFGGLWEYEEFGGVFHSERIQVVPFPPPAFEVAVRGWDKAGTQGGRGPRTAGVKIYRIPKGAARRIWGQHVSPTVRLDAIEFVIVHVVAGRWDDDIREQNIDAIAEGGEYTADDGRTYFYPGDGQSVKIVQEQEGGSGGKQSAKYTGLRLVGKGYDVRSQTATGDKEARARAMAAAVNWYMYAIVESDGRDGSITHEEVIAEFARFHNDANLIDIVDAGVHAHNEIVLEPEVPPPAVGPDRRDWGEMRAY